MKLLLGALAFVLAVAAATVGGGLLWLELNQPEPAPPARSEAPTIEVPAAPVRPDSVRAPSPQPEPTRPPTPTAATTSPPPTPVPAPITRPASISTPPTDPYVVATTAPAPTPTEPALAAATPSPTHTPTPPGHTAAHRECAGRIRILWGRVRRDHRPGQTRQPRSSKNLRIWGLHRLVSDKCQRGPAFRFPGRLRSRGQRPYSFRRRGRSERRFTIVLGRQERVEQLQR